MNVVLEGVDASGKSTLAAYLSNRLDLEIQPGSGPPRAGESIDDRVRAYLNLDGRLFDRHPCVSQMIYDKLRGGNAPVSPELLRQFYASKPLLVYCRGESITKHVVKSDEDPQHVAQISMKFNQLLRAYDDWGLRFATILYRIGDDMFEVANLVRAGLR